MNTRMRKSANRYAMRILLCTVVCLFTLSTMMMTAYAESEGGESAAAPTTQESTPAVQQSDTPAGQQNDTPATEQSDTPAGQQSDTPAEQQNDTPAGQQSDTSAEQQSDTPAGQQSDTPAEQQSDTPAGQQNDTPADQQSETTTTPSVGSDVQMQRTAAAASEQTGTAAGEENPDEPVSEDQVEVEAYAIPAGSAYIHEISKEVKYNNSAENHGNAINQAMADALTYLTDLYSDPESDAEFVATIVVQDGQYLDGLHLSTATEDSLFSKLISDLLGAKKDSTKEATIRVVAHDAIVENELGQIIEINAQSEGNVKLEGGIHIDVKGLNTLLAGLYLSTRDTVSIQNAASVEYYGTQQNDTINLTVSNIEGGENQAYIKVDSGAGNDTVVLEVRRKPNV